MENLEKKLINEIENVKKTAFDLNYNLAAEPELSGQEFKSSKKIVDLLNENGIEAELNFCDLETAFIGHVIKNENATKNIAILTEYDALPNVGHGCGHSASAAISVTTALVLKKLENELKDLDVNIDIIGTPDEEDKGLKIPMADQGAFDKYDIAIMAHLDTKNVPNWRLLAFETYSIGFKGTPAHTAASPWEGRSALDALMLFIHALDLIRKCTRPGAIIEGFIKEGGLATNIIPEYSEGKYTFRAKNYGYLKNDLLPWIMKALKGSAESMEVEYEYERYGYPFMDMNFNNTGTNCIEEVMNDYGLEFERMEAATGSSDIGNVSYRCPAFHPSIAITDKPLSLHTQEFADLVGSKKSEQCIVNGATVILAFLSRCLTDDELLKNIKEEFNKSIKK